MLGVAENGNSLRRSCEFGSDLLWPPPLESDGQYAMPTLSPQHTLTSSTTHKPPFPCPHHKYISISILDISFVCVCARTL